MPELHERPQIEIMTTQEGIDMALLNSSCRILTLASSLAQATTLIHRKHNLLHIIYPARVMVWKRGYQVLRIAEIVNRYLCPLLLVMRIRHQ